MMNNKIGIKYPYRRAKNNNPMIIKINAGDEDSDEHVSYSSELSRKSNFISNSSIFLNANALESEMLFNGLFWETSESAERLLEISKLMIFPSSGLCGTENDSILKEILREYVFMGGSIIIFSQQLGEHIDVLNLFPGGESINSYGFRKDSSSLKNSVYFLEIHPIL